MKSNHGHSGSRARAGSSRNGDQVAVLLDDIAALRKDVSSLISGRVDAATERTREFVDQTRERAEEVRERLGKRAGEHPIQTLLIAAAVGAVASRAVVWLLRR